MKKRLLALLMTIAMTVTILSGCGGDNSPKDKTSNNGTTAVQNDDSIKEFTIACLAGGDVNPPMNDWWIWEEYEKKTGIHINWEEIPGTAVEEKKNLLMASKNKPDAFWQIGFTTEELIRYGADGGFIDISPYMDEHAPNVKKVLEGINGGMQSCTMPDGGVYSLPWIMDDLSQTTLRYWINKNWLEAADLKVPTTIDELTTAFEAFKTKDVNGNGDPNDEWPIYYQPDGVGMFEQQLCGSFGLGDHGLKPLGEYYYIDDDNKVQYLYTSEKMKDLWKQMNEWWEKGYFHPETFGTLEYEKWVTDGKVNDLVGMYGWVGSNYLYSDAFNDYAYISALKGPDDKAVQSWCDHPVRGNSAFSITSACKAPITLLEWADYFYGEEGVNFANYGTEGVTYNSNENGDPVYIDEILNYEGGSQLGAFQYGLFVYGGGFPTLYADSAPMEIARKQDSETYKGERMSAFTKDSEKYQPECLPALIPTLEEAAELPSVSTDITAYAVEARTKFVTGEWNFDKDWDSFVEKMNKMGATRYTEIKQAQYDRYNQVK